MKFTYPGSEVALWTILLALGGSIVAYFSFQDDKVGFGVIYSIVALSCLLLWFDVRWAKWPIIAFNAFVVFGGALMQYRLGFDLRTSGKMVAAIYVAVLLFNWNGGPNAQRNDVSMDETFSP